MSPSQRHLPGLAGNPHSAHLQGLRSHVGAEAEKFIDELHAVCARAGLAWVSRVSSHVKILRHLGRGRIEGALTGASVVDAMGWTRDGRAIALEIKHVDVAHLRSGAEAAWRLPLSRIEEHQRTMLRACHAAGGLALLVVLHGGRVYAMPWPEVEAAILDGQASLSREDFAPHLCDHRRPYLARWVPPAPAASSAAPSALAAPAAPSVLAAPSSPASPVPPARTP
jgi:hypothetical protein